MSSMGGEQTAAVKTGCLDDGGWESCVPGMEVWCTRKAAWVEAGSGVPGWESWDEMPGESSKPTGSTS